MTPKQLKRFADNLKSLRLRRRLTQEAMAQALQVSVKTVARWERAEAEPDRSAREKLDEFFGRPLERVAGIRSGEWKVAH